MIYKNFRFSIFIRVFIIVVLALLLAFVVLRNPTFFVPLVIGLALIAAVINLIQYIEKSNRDLTHFLLSLRQGAYTESYTSGQRGKPYEALSDAFNEVVREFANLNIEKELHYQYLEALNENINVAIVSFDAEGKLLMINPAAKKLLNLPSFSSIHHFKKIDLNLYETIVDIKPEERLVTKVFIGQEIYQLSVQSKFIILQGKQVKIILLQNLNSELEAKEIEAWYQLIRVLTHEIMNSVTPIVSLTAAMQTMLNTDGTRRDLSKLSDDNIDDVFSSLSTIASRSKGLLKFVHAYKEYAKPLELHQEPVDVVDLVTRVVELLRLDIRQSLVEVQVIHADKSALANVDIALMEQVLINLIKNALEALPKNGAGKIIIEIKTKLSNEVSISVTDNGPGIDPEILPKIFIPFFTTKTSGSGIGLSLSRQILKLHNGNLKVHSALGEGSTFIMEWR
jgi:signal transduction histidine kinase